ncbi:nodulation protein [Methylobacterium radiotolerans]|nr:nodulation protein [Methylobacterium radiotolerans]
MRSRAPQTSGGEPTLRVPARESGPASAQLRPAPSDASATVQPNQQPGQSRNAGFDHMVDQLQQVSDQVVQVSIVSKTTSSFTGSLNKLLSSG